MELIIIFTILFLAFMTAVFLTWYFTHKSREKERLIMLEKGMDLPQTSEKKTFNFSFPWLKIGIIITGLMLGLILGAIIENLVNIREINFTPVVMILFGAIGMILAHYLDKK